MQGDNELPTTETIRQLQAENQALQAKMTQLQAAHQATLQGLEKRLAFEKKHEQSQLRFQTIFEQSKLGNKIIAPDLRILKVNDALVKMLGYSKAELEGTRIIDYARADFESHWQELQENLWARQIPSFRFETVLIRKDGSFLWCAVTSTLYKDGDDTLGYTILEDIANRKDLEARLKKIYDSQETMMHVVAHDLKNPIHIIKSLSGFLQEEVEALPAAVSRQQSITYITMIGAACEKAHAIIKDLLLMGELESRTLTASKQTVDLNHFIESQVALLQVTAQQKGVSILVHVPPGEVRVPIHPEKFARVLDNLLSNAVKFTPEGGQVLVSLRQEETKKVTLQVSDNGVGIPHALQGSVFDKFTKANRQGTEGETTTGLGLFIARQIVELHQGKIWLESREQEGTTFYVELPVG
jgi:two-component system sensor histidine kinase VicK